MTWTELVLNWISKETLDIFFVINFELEKVYGYIVKQFWTYKRIEILLNLEL